MSFRASRCEPASANGTGGHSASRSGPLVWLRESSGWPAVTRDPASSEATGDRKSSRLACESCLSVVTNAAERILVAGSHDHTFSNPYGMSYHIGCFAHAPGGRPVGEPSTYWSWFSGHSWQVEVCAACRQHLGWLFRSPGQRFHGLILGRLVELDDEDG